MNKSKPHFVSRTAEALLEVRALDELSSGEFVALLKSYNAVGAIEASFAATCTAIQLFPNNLELLRWHRDVSCAYLDDADLVGEFRRCCVEMIGPGAFWYLAIADCHLAKAWGSDESMLGLPDCPESLALAARELEADGVLEFPFENYVGSVEGRVQPTFNEWFDGLLRFERYAHLRRDA